MMPESTKRPGGLKLRPENIPQELRALDQWVGWRWKRMGNDWTKVPYDLKTGQAASSDDPSTWSSYSQTEGHENIGFMFSAADSYAGVDLDECVNPTTGILTQAARRIVESFATYAEVSPSGTGVKLFVKGEVASLGPRRKNSKKKMEMYDSGRFFTVTGHKIESVAGEPQERQEKLDELYRWLFPDDPENAQNSGATAPVGGWHNELSDEDILSQAFRSRQGERFFKLWNGDGSDYGSPSEADQALASMLAFWCGPDPERIEAMFSKSLLARDKWRERADYRRRTIEKALKGRTEFYGMPREETEEERATLEIRRELDADAGKVTETVTDGERAVALERKVRGFDTFTLAELMAKDFPPVRWIVPGLVPEGTMLLAGKPKMGKSWMALNLCVAVAMGGKALGSVECEEGDVLYLALEDNERRLKDRAAKVLDSVAGKPNGRLHLATAGMRLDEGALDALELWLSRHPEARLVVIDTVAKVRSQRERKTLYEQDYEVGSDLTKLAGIYRVAIVLVHHLKKGDAEDPMDLISGSTGLTGGVDGSMVLNRTRSSADAVLKAVHRDLKDDPELALSWDPEKAAWTVIGDAEEYRMSKERRDIMEVLANADGPMKPKEIAEALDKLTPAISKTLQRMREDGHVDNEGYGKYVIARGVSAPPTLGLGNSGPSSPNGPSSTDGRGWTGSTTWTGDTASDWRDHPFDCECEDCIHGD